VTTPAARLLPPALHEAPGLPDTGVLDALLDAVDEQRTLLARDIDQLLDDFFVESCSEWALPYIGRLLGLPADAERLEVAFAVALRRRKGTPAALEDFAEVVTGWTARAVEGWQVTAWAQRLAHPAPPRPAFVDLKVGTRFRLGTTFERVRRTVSPSQRWSPDAATVVVWPWSVRELRNSEALSVGTRRYALHPFGAEAPLYLRPRPRRLASDALPASAQTRTGNELDAPVRARYRVIQALAERPGDLTYGVRWTLGSSHPLATPSDPARPAPLIKVEVANGAVPWSAVRFGSLPPGAANPAPASSEIIVDVDRGLVELGASFSSTGRVRATWHRPVAGSLGALTADAVTEPSARVVINVDTANAAPTSPLATEVPTLADAFKNAEAICAQRNLQASDSVPERPDVEIRLMTSDRLQGLTRSFQPRLPRWRVVAPGLTTPTVAGDLDLNMTGACLTLEGFYLAGDLKVGKDCAAVQLAGVTMNPPDDKVISLAPGSWGTELRARKSILGAIRADLAAVPVTLEDSIVDARGARLRVCGDPDPGNANAVAIRRRDRFDPGLRARGVTFAGRVQAEWIDATDCIFVDGLDVVQHQEGCLRHCYLGPDATSSSSLPPAYRCGPFPAPAFSSIGFESAGYHALALDRDQALLSAASDGGEVGAYHHARRGPRIRRLRQRVHEFVPLGLRPLVELAPWEE
jgi:hypothetical protein